MVQVLIRYLCLMSTIQCFVIGCASSSVVTPQAQSVPQGAPSSGGAAVAGNSNDCVLPPPPAGGKHTVEIVEFGVAAADIEKYPQLRENRVGFGLAERLVQTIADAGHFRLMEGTEEIVKRIATQWQATADGILTHPRKAEPGMLAAEFFLYVRVYDFVACSSSEEIRGAGRQQSCRMSVGAQVRIIDPTTREYAPGSADGSVTDTVDESIFGGTETPFDQSSVGRASQKAIHCALGKALQSPIFKGMLKGGNP